MGVPPQKHSTSSRLYQTNWWDRLRRIIIKFVLPYIVPIILSVIAAGLYTGSLPPWIGPMWNNIAKFIAAYSLIFTTVVAILGTAGTTFFWNNSRMRRIALTTTHNVVELDDSLLRLLTNLVTEFDSKSIKTFQIEMQRLLQALLRDTIRTILGEEDRGRAAILLPNTPNPNEEYLQIRANHRIPRPSIERTKFYIGKDEDKELERGVAGVAYVEKKLHVGHIFIKENGYWQCDDKNYKSFDESRVHLPYLSFVCVPIIGPSKGADINCLGIVCFDSLDPKVFDSPEVQTLLQTFARRIAGALSIYCQLLWSRDQAAPYFSEVSRK